MSFQSSKNKPEGFIFLNAHIRWLANCYARAVALRNVSQNKTFGQSGFTLLEMMVVIAIVIIMTGILLGNLPSFRDNTSLALVAQEIAVNIRGAQVYGIGTKVSNGKFPGHGIYFCNPTLVGCKKNFLLFSDDASAGVKKWFDFAAEFSRVPGLANTAAWNTQCRTDSAECSEVYALQGNIEVCQTRVYSGAVGSPVFNPDNLSITFSRLYPDAFIKTDSSSGTNYDYGEIVIRSTRLLSANPRIIKVYNTGAITVSMGDKDSCATAP